MPEQHAYLSASGAHIWLNCPPSVRLGAQFPDQGSSYATEGTLAHSLGELKLRKRFDLNCTGEEYAQKLAEIKADPLYQPEMDSYTDTYADYVTKICMSFPSKPMVAVEQRLDFSHIVPDGFGTGDCVIIHEDELHICDLKYGKGVPVSAQNNPQLRLYATGAVRAYALLFSVKKVYTHIIQPRLDNFDKESLTVADLIIWGNGVKRIAAQAYAGEGDFQPGEHCRFCRAKAQCAARAKALLGLEEPKARQDHGELLTDEEIGSILTRAITLKAWIEALETYAKDQLSAGKPIPGWKLVEGRSTAKISDFEAAAEKLTGAGYDRALLYKQSPLGLTDLDKLVGGRKQLKGIIGDLLIKPAGAPTMVPESDKRKPIAEKKLAEMFGDTNNGGN